MSTVSARFAHGRARLATDELARISELPRVPAQLGSEHRSPCPKLQQSKGPPSRDVAFIVSRRPTEAAASCTGGPFMKRYRLRFGDEGWTVYDIWTGQPVRFANSYGTGMQ